MTVQLLCEPPALFNPCEFRIKWASNRWELHGALALRRAVFCAEQGVFAGDDLDAVDREPLTRTLVALACVAGEADQVVGTVRIHPGHSSDGEHHQHADGLWWGSRLAVHAGFRQHARLGSALIRLAVCSAHARGAALFLAHVQAQNEALFQRLHWHTLKDLALHGRPHRLMQADLAHYPPCHDPITGFVQRSVAPA